MTRRPRELQTSLLHRAKRMLGLGRNAPSAPARRLRIAFGRINQETNALSAVPTTFDDFARVHLMLEGPVLLQSMHHTNTEVDGFMKQGELTGFFDGVTHEAAHHNVAIDLIPLASAWAVPGGPLTRACYEEIVEHLLRPLREAQAIAPLDAVFLSLHGAMGVSDLPLPPSETPESEIIRRVREIVGDDIPVGVTLDLHGNIARGLIERTTIVQGYRTNPHRDHAAVGDRVGRILLRTCIGLQKPTQAWRSLPLILGGGNTIDFLNPMRPLFRHMTKVESGNDDVLAMTVMTVHPWNNHVELGWSVVVATNGDQALAERLADELADLCWAVRVHQPPKFLDPTIAIERARRATFLRKIGTVVLADASDVVSAGAPGENVRLMDAFWRHGRDLTTYFPLRDPALVDHVWQHHSVGQEIDVVLGSKLDPTDGSTLALKMRIVSMPRAIGVERMVVLQVDKLFVVVTQGPALAIRPAFYANAGLDVLRADVVIVKNFFPFLMFFLPYARLYLYVKTKGVTDFDAAFALPFVGAVHPRDAVEDWRPTDQRRRGLSTP